MQRSRSEPNDVPLDLSSLLDDELVIRSLSIAPKNEAFAKGVAQASDGLCCVFSAGSGNLLFVAAKDRAADLGELVDDLASELGPR